MLLADAHIHLFERSFQSFFTGRPGVEIDEAACYDSIARDHNVAAALVIGYEDEASYRGNTEYIALQRSHYNWIYPAAYIEPEAPPSLQKLEQWKNQGFVGLTIYIRPKRIKAIQVFPDEIWSWMIQNRWFVSSNFKTAPCSSWIPVLEKHLDLRLMLSHLGSPPRVKQPINRDQAQHALADQIQLSQFPQVYVKLSGFYAITDPGHDYPHEQAWPYVYTLLEAYGDERLLWGSDFSPSLDWLTFPQTFSLFEKMPFLDAQSREKIAGANLLNLLDEASES